MSHFASFAVVVFLMALVAIGYRRSMPPQAIVRWQDRIWMASGSIAVGGMAMIAFALVGSGLHWPNNMLASLIIAVVAFSPLVICFLMRLPRQAR